MAARDEDANAIHLGAALALIAAIAALLLM